MVMAERIAGYEPGSKSSPKRNGKRIEEMRIILQKKLKHVYRFKVTLNYIKPALWRSIEVPENTCKKAGMIGVKNCQKEFFRVRVLHFWLKK